MRVIKGVTTVGKYSLPYEAVIPEVEDVRRAMPRRAAELAIRVLAVEEQYVREHLSIGSTPPTRVPVWKVPWRLAVIQKAVWRLWETSRGCVIAP